MISHNWSPMKRLIWLRGSGITGGAGTYETITGNPVSFTAKAAPLRQLKVAFSPVQDLHGYDAPWPAGGGANKWDEEWEAGALSGTTGEETLNNTMSRSKFIPVKGGETYYLYASGIDSTHEVFVFKYDENGTYLNPYIKYEANTTFSVGANCTQIRIQYRRPIAEVVNYPVAINYPVTVTTYSPYSNECPILGWDSLNVEQRGKNIADDTDLKTSSYNIYNCPNPLKNSTQYTYSVFGTTSNGFRLMAAHANTATPTPNIGVSTGYISSGNHNTFTTPADIEDYEYIYFAGNAAGAGQSDASFVVTLGSDAPSEYVPYNPSSSSISITIGSTVYSGTVDVVTGVVTVDMASVDLGTLTWQHYDPSVTNLPVFFSSLDNCKPSTKPLCSAYNPTWWQPLQNETDMTVKIHPALGIAYVVDSRFSDAATFKTAMSGVILCYELAEPLTIQLTPQEVESLLGENTLWSDANQPLTVTYRSN